MINSEAINFLSPFKERTIALKIFDETDHDFLNRVKRVFTDNCLFQVSLNDGDNSIAETDQLIFGERSLLITQIRLGEPYTKDNGAIDVKGIKNEFIIDYNEIKKITSNVRDNKDILVFELSSNNIINSIAISSNLKITELAVILDKIIKL